VPGEGSSSAKIMFIGEGPGATEDKLGRPFVGAAGKVLDILLESIGLARAEIYIANTVKCRPPENRDPTEDEKMTCRPWLDEQIRLINPEIFVPLGRHALHQFLPEITISSAHGKIYEVEGKVVFAMYHPAVSLYNGGMRPTLVKDMLNLKLYLEGKIIPEIYNIRDLYKKTPKDNSKNSDEVSKSKSKKIKGVEDKQIDLF
jgi:DNA polymerase